MHIIIAGPRIITDYEHVRQAMIHSGYWKQYKKEIIVVCGMALSWKWKEDPLIGGVDRLGYNFAKKNGLDVKEFHPDWKEFGKAAGIIRNHEMGKFTKEQGGLLLAVWDGQSTGTKDMITWAQKNDLLGYVYRVDKPARYAKIGSVVFTDYSGKKTKHTITKRHTDQRSQSGVILEFTPAVSKVHTVLDADWFVLAD